MRKWVWFWSAVVCCSISQPALAQRQRVKEMTDAILAKWAVQEKAAEADRDRIRLIREVINASTKNGSVSADPRDVDIILEDLKKQFPDFRLRYRSVDDYCPLMHALDAADQDARIRLLNALHEKLKVIAIHTTQARILLNVTTGELLNDENVADAIARGALQELARAVPVKVETTFNTSSYAKVEVPMRCP